MYTPPFSHVNCGQLQCQNAGNYRLSVNEPVTILTRGVYADGEGIVYCKYVCNKSSAGSIYIQLYNVLYEPATT